MNIEEALNGPARESLPAPLADPFAADDLLAEGDLQKVRWDVAADVLWVLIDMKGAYQFPEANTGVLVVSGVIDIRWKGRPRGQRGRWGTMMVGSSRFRDSPDGRSFFFGGLNGEELTLMAERFEFWEGDVAGGDDPPPAYDEEDDETIRAGLTDWLSTFTPVAFVARGR